MEKVRRLAYATRRDRHSEIRSSCHVNELNHFIAVSYPLHVAVSLQIPKPDFRHEVQSEQWYCSESLYIFMRNRNYLKMSFRHEKII